MRYHGAKFRIADWVIAHFPAHRIYVEPFGGAAGVLLKKRRSYAEVYNDIDSEVVNFFRVMQNPGQLARLTELLTLTPFAREEFELAGTPSDDPVEKARRMVIRAEMGFGSAGATKGRTGFRTDTVRRYSTVQHIWERYPDRLASIAKRFAGVLVENRPASEVIAMHDTPETLHFIDPPYLHETRVIGSNRYYRHEMSADQHVELLDQLKGLSGMVVVCGYDSDLYRGYLADWECNSRQTQCAAGRGAGIRNEFLWLNQAAMRQLNGWLHNE